MSLAMLFVAAIDPGLIKGIVVLVIVIVSLLRALANKVAEAQREAARRARPPKPVAPKSNDPLADEITDFLKRAAQTQRPKAAPPESKETPRRPPLPASPSRPPLAEAMKPFRPSQPAPIPKPSEPRQAPVKAKRESVAEHVRDQLGSRKFAQVGTQGLGKEVSATDDKNESRLRGVFGHQLSELSSVGGEASETTAAVPPASAADRFASAPVTNAAALAAFLANPATLRQAILVGEILHRPEERWNR